MLDREDYNRKTEALCALLRVKLGLRGRDFSTRLGRAGRLLPKQMHRAGKTIVDAGQMVAHPRLARLVDARVVNTAISELSAYLNEIDPKDRRKGKLLGWMAAQVVNLIAIAVLLIALLNWRGLIRHPARQQIPAQPQGRAGRNAPRRSQNSR